MADTIGSQQICRMLLQAMEQIRAHHEMLSRLDAAVGDGDHGTTILRTMEAAGRTAGENSAAGPAELLGKVGWAVLDCDGGSTGPLLGSFFLGLSEGAAGKSELDLAAVVAMFRAGVAKLQKQSRAQAGDKTMMDAFLPALAALEGVAPDGAVRTALEAASKAAADGAEQTKNFRARFGRARNLGDRVLGHLDPGAVSVSLILKGFSQY